MENIEWKIAKMTLADILGENVGDDTLLRFELTAERDNRAGWFICLMTRIFSFLREYNDWYCGKRNAKIPKEEFLSHILRTGTDGSKGFAHQLQALGRTLKRDQPLSTYGFISMIALFLKLCDILDEVFGEGYMYEIRSSFIDLLRYLEEARLYMHAEEEFTRKVSNMISKIEAEWDNLYVHCKEYERELLGAPSSRLHDRKMDEKLDVINAKVSVIMNRGKSPSVISNTTQVLIVEEWLRLRRKGDSSPF